MHDDNQGSPSDFAPAPAEAPLPGLASPFDRESKGLGLWLAALLACGGGGLLFGLQEMAALIALAGLFVAAQAADIDPRWRSLYYLVSWIVPVGGAAIAMIVAFALLESDLPATTRNTMIGIAAAGGVISLLSVLRPISDRMSALLFRGETPSHTLRLAARLTSMTLVLALPGWFAFRAALGTVLEDPRSLLEHVSLWGELIGYTLLALASVGFMVQRNLPATLQRLGIRPIPTGHLAIVAMGVIALYGLNAGADWIERMFFHDLWRQDQHFNEMLASGLGPGRVLMLGLSAGIGEEITMRGALQPKLGLVMTSLLFAVLHVQYSWFGIVVIFLLGIVLGTIRAKTSTSVAMAVHAIYDILAVFSI